MDKKIKHLNSDTLSNWGGRGAGAGVVIGICYSFVTFPGYGDRIQHLLGAALVGAVVLGVMSGIGAAVIAGALDYVDNERNPFLQGIKFMIFILVCLLALGFGTGALGPLYLLLTGY